MTSRAVAHAQKYGIVQFLLGSFPILGASSLGVLHYGPKNGLVKVAQKTRSFSYVSIASQKIPQKNKFVHSSLLMVTVV